MKADWKSTKEIKPIAVPDTTELKAAIKSLDLLSDEGMPPQSEESAAADARLFENLTFGDGQWN
jgi:hypothetical protein